MRPKLLKFILILGLNGSLFSCVTLHSFETFIDLTQTDLNKLRGKEVYTKGFYQSSDGGGGPYFIIAKQDFDPSKGFLKIWEDSITTICKKITSQSVVNLKQIGAKGDGLTDDTPYFDKAFGLIKKFSCSLFLPKGEYLVSREKEFIFELKSLDQFALNGEGREETIIRLNNQWEKYQSIFFFRGEINQISLKNLSFKGEIPLNVDSFDKNPSFEKQSNSLRAIYSLDEIEVFLIEDCLFADFSGAAIQLSHIGDTVKFARVVIKNCLRETIGKGFKQPQATGMLINKGVNSLSIIDCQFDNIVDLGKNGLSHAVYLQNVEYGAIINCNFKVDPIFPFQEFKACGIHIFRGENGTINIEHNRFKNTHSNLYNGKKIKVSNNYFENSRLVIGSNNLNLVHNKFVLSTSTSLLGIVRTAEKINQLNVESNEFIHIPGASKYSVAIQLYNSCSKSSFKDNVIKNFYTGFLLGGVKDAKIDFNKIVNNRIYPGKDSRYGVLLKNGNNNQIEGNLVEYSKKKNQGSFSVFSEQPKSGILRNNISKNNQIKN